ncbi:hypothetical protein KIH74_18155 [Kineosporia sp. J2-2]|uniref:Uncharacterized protein n=1 Tax=Kineosporia corallincola TaxID=2835133 RepID=A0ABS5TIE6_9ACTN|nr:hypothetical protein [Kineosporia corallincola]MBT0770869.1 hypothetical protein [Kineosporia corallincola]
MRVRRLSTRVGLAVAAGAIGLGAAGIAVAYPAFAATVPDDPSATGAPPTPTGTPTPTRPSADGKSRLEGSLKDLVDDGTITQEQADKVAEKLAGSGIGSGPEVGLHGRATALALDEVAKALGLSEDEVSSALADGRSVKDLAEQQGKDVDDVIDALVEAATEKIHQAVEAGDLTQEAADGITPKLKERITWLVENGLPKLPGLSSDGRNAPEGWGGWGGGRQFHQWHDEQGDDETPAPSSSSGSATQGSSFSGAA